MVSKSCWDIMGCADSWNCRARQNPEKKCWEHSRDIGAFQNYFRVCPDCIVYVTSSNNWLLTDKQINDSLLKKRKINKRITGQCPLSNYIDLKSGYGERREARRYNCNGNSHAIISNNGYLEHSCKLLNISESGLAFVSKDVVSENESILTMNVQLDGVSVNDIPLSIVSDVPLTSVDDQFRYSGKFESLSYNQESKLSAILNHYEIN